MDPQSTTPDTSHEVTGTEDASLTMDTAPAAASAQPNRNATKPNPQQENVPPTGAASGSSFLDSSSFDIGKGSDSFNDQILHETLPEAESSFIAPLSPIPTISKEGLDDTYLFDSPRKRTPPAAPAALSITINKASDADTASEKTPTLPTDFHTSDNLDSHSEADKRAAHAESGQSRQANDDSAAHDTSATSYQSQDSDPQGRLQPDSTATSLGLRSGDRPRYLKSRTASQRSSTSSFTTNPDSHDDVDSDVTVGLGTDYALQSGGAIPAHVGQGSDRLLRSISIGSMISTVDDFHEPTSRLETLAENDNTMMSNNEDFMRTPKAKAPLAPPTDTVLARRVMDVQVPESLAKEYKSKGGLMTPRKPSDFGTTGSLHRPGRNMTLKEQSSTIERLSKENFDLKLKVMFLSDRLDKLSEDGIKEMIQENVEFRTNIAVLQRDNKALRRRVKELEKKLTDENDRPGTSRSAASSGQMGDGFESEMQEKDEEIAYLRERVEESTTVIENLRKDMMAKETEKRRMADVVRSLQSVGEKNVSENLGRKEEEDVWKDLLEQETARREQADDENRKLRDEIFRMRQELHSTTGAGAGSGVGVGAGTGALHHTTNIYNITKKANGPSGSQVSSALPADVESSRGTTAGSTTLVEELRREGEHLRHENAELRKEVGAQTSMLTSRNKEKERLYQEIEDLKMAQRRGGGPAPSTIDSFLDRSASQVGGHERSGSRVSGGTRAETIVDDPEREELENENATLRDKINEAKLENQTLMQEYEALLQQKQESEDVALSVQKDYEGAMADLMAMQSERDELIAELNDIEQKHSALETQFEDLRAEAQEAIDGYEEEADVRDADNQKLQVELNERTENFNALQEEMRKLSEALVGLEDETDNKVRRVQELEEELSEANKELEELEAKLLESNDKAQRLLVQQENSQGEIAFLREEQESDKITISRLEVNVVKVEEQLRDEQERVKQLQQQIVTERERSETLATKDKKDMQHFINELSREASVAKDEARKLRKNLTSREVEATEWKERLMELENNLREALGDLSGTRSSLLKSIAKLQRELENTVRELDTTKASLMEKDRIIKQRDALLESHGLEARKVAEALEKERALHRNTKNQFDTFQKTHQHVSRTVSTQDQRIIELETSKTQDKKRISLLESTFKDQLHERNNLLLVLWTRLSALCGTDWAHNNSLINGRALPSLEAVATMLPGFSRNLMAAIKHIESIISAVEGRIKSVERDLWREYHNLENNLDARTKKLDRLEAIIRNGIATGKFGTSDLHNRMLRMEEAYRQLKVENATLRTANEVRARATYSNGELPLEMDASVSGGSPSPSIPTGPRDRGRTSSVRPKTSSRSSVPRPSTASRGLTAGELALQDTTDAAGAGGEGFSTDPRWILRLRDLENKLKLEREGRTMDRNEAARRLREQEAEIHRRDERDKRSRRDSGTS